MVKDIFIDSTQNADAEHSEVYKMTEEIWVCDLGPKARGEGGVRP